MLLFRYKQPNRYKDTTHHSLDVGGDPCCWEVSGGSVLGGVWLVPERCFCSDPVICIEITTLRWCGFRAGCSTETFIDLLLNPFLRIGREFRSSTTLCFPLLSKFGSGETLGNGRLYRGKGFGILNTIFQILFENTCHTIHLPSRFLR